MKSDFDVCSDSWGNLSFLRFSVFSDKLADLQFSSLLLRGCHCPSLFTTKIPIVFESALVLELPPHFVLNNGSVLCFFLPSFFPFFLRYHCSLDLWPSLSTARSEPLLLRWGQRQWLPSLSDTPALHSGALWGSSSLRSSQLAAPSTELLTHKQTETRGARGSVILSSPVWGSASCHEYKKGATILSGALTRNLVCVI